MADVELDRNLNERVARSAPVKADLRRRGMARQAASEARHAAHRDQGHSRVEGFQGDIDYNIVLDDTRGELAAMSIEFGTVRTAPTHTLTGVPLSVGGGDADV